MNLQDMILNQARTKKLLVNVFLMNGFKIMGTISCFDPFVVVITENGGKQNMIYKHAISTISPVTPIPIFKEQKEQKGKETEGLGKEDTRESDGEN